MIKRFLPFRLRRKWESNRHDAAARKILKTPPIVPVQDGLVIFSMIGTAVLMPYLVAVKSLWNELGRGRIVILNDGTLTAKDRDILAQHCGNPQIIEIDAVELGGFPRGGCWERFLTILDHRDEYWLQLDSDTVTIGPVPEVASAILANRAFTLLGGPQAEIGALTFAESAAYFWPNGAEAGDHIQAQIESRLGEVRNSETKLYIRGCAGFAGFPRGFAGRAEAAWFQAAMAELIGDEGVTRWGSEQVASNMVIANAQDPLLLPYARYMNYWNEAWGKDTGFIHFVGAHRHDNGAYIAATKMAIARLGKR